MQADNVPDLKDFRMVLQLLAENVAEDIPGGLVSYLQNGAEIWTGQRRGALSGDHVLHAGPPAAQL